MRQFRRLLHLAPPPPHTRKGKGTNATYDPCPTATIGLAFPGGAAYPSLLSNPIYFGHSNPYLLKCSHFQPISATLSDIVVYSRRGATRAAFAVAEKFKQAVEARAGSRIPYHVFVLDATPAELRSKLRHLLVSPRTINFAQREKDEMRELTRASEILTIHSPEGHRSADVHPWSPGLGQVFLGNVNDVPFFPGNPSAPNIDLLDSAGNFPADGMGYDVCIECRLRAPRPALGFLYSAQEHLMELERRWQASGGKGPRPPPNAAAIVYLPFPLLPIVDEMVLFLEFLEKLLKPTQQRGFGRPAKILIWSSDGYTESSVLALSLIMAMRGVTLPEAYLELQVSPKGYGGVIQN